MSKPHVCPVCKGSGEACLPIISVRDNLSDTHKIQSCPACKGTCVVWEPKEAWTLPAADALDPLRKRYTHVGAVPERREHATEAIKCAQRRTREIVYVLRMARGNAPVTQKGEEILTAAANVIEELYQLDAEHSSDELNAAAERVGEILFRV